MQPEQTPVFDLNAQQAKQRKMLRLVIILAAALIGVLVLVAALAPKDITGQKLSLALARHQEMNRVLEAFADNARGSDARQLVANARIVLLSGTTELTAAGVSVSTVQADSVKTSGIDDDLAEASRNNQFDAAITEFLSTKIQANRADLAAVEDEVDKNQAEVIRQLLNDYDSLL